MSSRDEVEISEHDFTFSLSEMSRECFPTDLWDLMPNCQNGFDEYVRLSMTRRNVGRRRTFWSAKLRGQPAGCAEWVDRGGARFLNHICTLPTMQGRGVARALIQQPNDDQFYRQVELDTFIREPAIAMYERLGFRTISSNVWHLRCADGVKGTAQELLTSDSIAFFQNQLQAFGFSRLEASWHGKAVTVSFPSDKVARLAAVDSFEDNDFLAAIRAAIPTVERFAVICAPETPVSGSDATLTSSRLIGHLPLAKRPPEVI